MKINLQDFTVQAASDKLVLAITHRFNNQTFFAAGDTVIHVDHPRVNSSGFLPRDTKKSELVVSKETGPKLTKEQKDAFLKRLHYVMTKVGLSSVKGRKLVVGTSGVIVDTSPEYKFRAVKLGRDFTMFRNVGANVLGELFVRVDHPNLGDSDFKKSDLKISYPGQHKLTPAEQKKFIAEFDALVGEDSDEGLQPESEIIIPRKAGPMIATAGRVPTSKDALEYVEKSFKYMFEDLTKIDKERLDHEAAFRKVATKLLTDFDKKREEIRSRGMKLAAKIQDLEEESDSTLLESQEEQVDFYLDPTPEELENTAEFILPRNLIGQRLVKSVRSGGKR